MGKVKGHFRRRIREPGYHLHSQYDLKSFRERKEGGGSRQVDVELPLTSMIDMFSMLVIFLLMNFSSSGEVFFISKDMKLPGAAHSHPLENAPLLSITRDNVILDSQNVADNPLHLEEKDKDMPQLKIALKNLRRQEEQAHPNQPFKGQINIQADENTPIVYIKRVMTILVTEGWGGINFAVKRVE